MPLKRRLEKFVNPIFTHILNVRSSNLSKPMSVPAYTHPSVPGALSTFPIFSPPRCLPPPQSFSYLPFPRLYPTPFSSSLHVCLPAVLEVQTKFLCTKSGCLDWAVCQSGPYNL